MKVNERGKTTMALADTLLEELEQEAVTTRRVLERVPEKNLNWRPHEKSRTLGELALHIANTPGGVAQLASSPSPAQVPQFTDPSPQTTAELLVALDQSIAQARKVLTGMDDATAISVLRIVDGEREVFSVPRIGLLRSIMLNHWYHHRGQLSVYLRELNVPIPSIYGPSADENPFA
jgi:uncharacterized damage-inducible protein DinB